MSTGLIAVLLFLVWGVIAATREGDRKRPVKKTGQRSAGSAAGIRINHPHIISEDEYECGVCGRRFTGEPDSCPYCGAGFTGSVTDYEEFDDEEDEMEAWDEEDGW